VSATTPARLLGDRASVEAFADRARDSGRVALDTEFFWERTYAPVLCLVQAAVEDEIVLIDPLAGVPVDAIAALVADPAVETVMHAPGGDLLAFATHFGTRPANVTDTQILAGFVGLTASASLERLLQAVLDVKPGQHESFSDWQARPLTPDQLTYAADDVRFLLPLTDRLRERLGERGRSDWAADELRRRYPDGGDVVSDVGDAWKRVQRRNRLSGKQLAVLREVAAWREEVARRRDQPASWVLKDPSLVEVARIAPADARALMRIRGIPKGFGAGDQEALLTAVERGRTAEPIQLPKPPNAQVQHRLEAASGLAATLVRVRCAEHDVATELVATRSEADGYIRRVLLDEPTDDLLLGIGWRLTLVGEEIQQLCRGHVALSVADRAPWIEISRR
jgi:ribonuclease D